MKYSAEDVNKENSEENYDEEGKWPIYVEDDEDYDNIVTKSFDLSLRKQIIKKMNLRAIVRFLLGMQYISSLQMITGNC